MSSSHIYMTRLYTSESFRSNIPMPALSHVVVVAMLVAMILSLTQNTMIISPVEAAPTTITTSTTVPTTTPSSGTRTFTYNDYNIFQQPGDTTKLDFILDIQSISNFLVSDVPSIPLTNSSSSLPRDELSLYSTCLYDRPDVQEYLTAAGASASEPLQGTLTVSLTNSIVGSPTLADPTQYGPSPVGALGTRPARVIVSGLSSSTPWPTYLVRLFDLRIEVAGNTFAHGQLLFVGSFPDRTTIVVRGNNFYSELGSTNPTYFILNQIQATVLTLVSPCSTFTVAKNTFLTTQGIGANTALPILGDRGSGVAPSPTNFTTTTMNINLRSLSLKGGAVVAVLKNTLQVRGASMLTNIAIESATTDTIHTSILDAFYFQNGTRIPPSSSMYYRRHTSSAPVCMASQTDISSMLLSSSTTLLSDPTTPRAIRAALVGCGSLQVSFNNISTVTPETHLNGRSATFENGGASSIGYSTYVQNVAVDGIVSATTYKVAVTTSSITYGTMCSTTTLQSQAARKVVLTMDGQGVLADTLSGLWGTSSPSSSSDLISLLSGANADMDAMTPPSGILISNNVLTLRNQAFDANPTPDAASGRRESYGGFVSRSAAYGVVREQNALYHPLGPNATSIVVVYGTQLSFNGKGAGIAIHSNHFDISHCPDAAAVFSSPFLTIQGGGLLVISYNTFINVDAMTIVASALKNTPTVSTLTRLPYVLANSGIARAFVSSTTTPPKGGYGNSSTLLEGIYMMYIKDAWGTVTGLNSRIVVDGNDFAPSPLVVLGTGGGEGSRYVSTTVTDVPTPPVVTGNQTVDRAIALVRGSGSVENRPGLLITSIKSGSDFESSMNYVNGSFLSVSRNNAVLGNGTGSIGCYSITISSCNGTSSPSSLLFNTLDVLRAYDLINITTPANVVAGTEKIPKDVLPKQVPTWSFDKNTLYPQSVETLAPPAVNVSSIDLPSLTFINIAVYSSAINGGKILVEENAVGVASTAVLDAYVVALYNTLPAASRVSTSGSGANTPNNITSAPIVCIAVTTQKMVVSSSFTYASDIVALADQAITTTSTTMAPQIGSSSSSRATESIVSDGSLNQTHWLNFTDDFSNTCGTSPSVQNATSASTVFAFEDSVLTRWIATKASVFSVSGNLAYVTRGNSRSLISVSMSSLNVTGSTWAATSRSIRRVQRGDTGNTPFIPLKLDTILRVPSAVVRVDGNVAKSFGTVLTSGVVEQEMIERRRPSTLPTSGSISVKSRPISVYVAGSVAIAQLGVIALGVETYSLPASGSTISINAPPATTTLSTRLSHSIASLPTSVRTKLQTRRRDYMCIPVASTTSINNYTMGMTSDTTMRFTEGGGLNQDTSTLVANGIRDVPSYSSTRLPHRFLSISHNTVAQPNVRILAYSNVTGMTDIQAETSIFVGYGALTVRSAGRFAGVTFRVVLPRSIALDAQAPNLPTINTTTANTVSSLTNVFCSAVSVWDSTFAPSATMLLSQVSTIAATTSGLSQPHALTQASKDLAGVYYPMTLRSRIRTLLAPSVGVDRNKVVASAYRWTQGIIITSAASSGGTSTISSYGSSYPTSYDISSTAVLQSVFSAWTSSSIVQNSLVGRLPSLLPAAVSLGDLDDNAMLGGNTVDKLSALQAALYAINRTGVSGDAQLLTINIPEDPYTSSSTTTSGASPSFTLANTISSGEDLTTTLSTPDNQLPLPATISINNNSVNIFPCLGGSACQYVASEGIRFVPEYFPATSISFHRRLFGLQLDMEAKHVLFGAQLLVEGSQVYAQLRKADLEVISIELNANARRRVAPVLSPALSSGIGAETAAFITMTAWSPTVLYHHSTFALKWSVVDMGQDYMYRSSITFAFRTALMLPSTGSTTPIPGVINVTDSSQFMIHSNNLKTFCYYGPSTSTGALTSNTPTSALYFTAITLSLLGESSVFTIGKNRILISAMGDFSQGVNIGTGLGDTASLMTISGCPSNYARQVPLDPSSPMISTGPKILLSPRRYEPNMVVSIDSIFEAPPPSTPGMIVNYNIQLSLEAKDVENRLLFDQRLQPRTEDFQGPQYDQVYAERDYVCSGMYITGNDIKVSGTTLFYDSGSSIIFYAGTADISNGAQLQITYNILFYEDKRDGPNPDQLKKPRVMRFGYTTNSAGASSFKSEAGFHLKRNTFFLNSADKNVPYVEVFLMPTTFTKPAAISIAYSTFSDNIVTNPMMVDNFIINENDAMLGDIYYEAQCNSYNRYILKPGNASFVVNPFDPPNPLAPGYGTFLGTFPLSTTRAFANWYLLTKVRSCVGTKTPTITLTTSHTDTITTSVSVSGNTPTASPQATPSLPPSKTKESTNSVSVHRNSKTLEATPTRSLPSTKSASLESTKSDLVSKSLPVTTTKSVPRTSSHSFTQFDPGYDNPCINASLRQLLFDMTPILPNTPITLRPTLSDGDLSSPDGRTVFSPVIPSNTAIDVYPDEVRMLLEPLQTSFAWNIDLETTDLYELATTTTPSGNVIAEKLVQRGTAYYLLKNESFAFARIEKHTVKSTTTSNNQDGFSGKKALSVDDVNPPRIIITITDIDTINPPRTSQFVATTGDTYTGKTTHVTRVRIDFGIDASYRIDVDEIMQIFIPTTSLMLVNTNKTINGTDVNLLQSSSSSSSQQLSNEHRGFDIAAAPDATSPPVGTFCQGLAPQQTEPIIWLRISPAESTLLPIQKFMGGLVGVSSGILGVASFGNIAPAALGAELQLAIALLGFTRCADPFTHRTFNHFSILSPFAVDSSFVGVLLGNAVVAGFVMFIQLCAFAVFRYHINVRSTSEILSKVRFPSVTFCVITSFYTASCFAAGYLIGYAPGYYLTGRVPEDEIAAEGSGALVTADGGNGVPYSPAPITYVIFSIGAICIVIFPIFLVYYAKNRITRAYQEYTVMEWADEKRSRANGSKYSESSTISLLASVLLYCHMFSGQRKRWVAYRDKSKLLDADNNGGNFETDDEFSDDEEGAVSRRPSTNLPKVRSRSETLAGIDDLMLEDEDETNNKNKNKSRSDTLAGLSAFLPPGGSNKTRSDTMLSLSEFMPDSERGEAARRSRAETLGGLSAFMPDDDDDDVNINGGKSSSAASNRRTVSFFDIGEGSVDSSSGRLRHKANNPIPVEPTELDKKMDTLIDRIHSSPFMVYFIIPQGAIYSADTRNAYGTYISSYRVYSHVWTTYPLWLGTAAFFLALLLSQDSVTSSIGPCQAIFASVGAFLAGLGIYSLSIVSPKRSRGDTLLDALSKGLVGTILIFAAISANGTATSQGIAPPYIIYILFILLIIVVILRLIIHNVMESYDRLFEQSHDAVLSIGLTTVWSHIPRETAQVNKTFDILRDTSDTEDATDVEMVSGIRARFEDILISDEDGSSRGMTPVVQNGGEYTAVVVMGLDSSPHINKNGKAGKVSAVGKGVNKTMPPFSTTASTDSNNISADSLQVVTPPHSSLRTPVGNRPVTRSFIENILKEDDTDNKLSSNTKPAAAAGKRPIAAASGKTKIPPPGGNSSTANKAVIPPPKAKVEAAIEPPATPKPAGRSLAAGIAAVSPDTFSPVGSPKSRGLKKYPSAKKAVNKPISLSDDDEDLAFEI